MNKNKNFSEIRFIKILSFLAMLNFCSSFEIIIAQNDRNEFNQVWIENIKKQFEPDIELYQCDYSLISECVNSHPNAIIVLDLSKSFETQLSLSQLCKESNKIHLVPHSSYLLEQSILFKWKLILFLKRL